MTIASVAENRTTLWNAPTMDVMVMEASPEIRQEQRDVQGQSLLGEMAGGW